MQPDHPREAGDLGGVLGSAAVLGVGGGHTLLQKKHEHHVFAGGGPEPRRRVGSCPTPSRGVSWPRNERSILLAEEQVCAPTQYVPHSTKKAPELLRTPCIRTSQNPQKAKFAELLFHALQ